MDMMYAVISILGVVLTVILVRIFLKLTIMKYESDVAMKGKVVIVTGANTGIGYFTAKDLAARGARVILACRNGTKAIAARRTIIEATGSTNVVYKHLNLSSLKSVRKFANDIIDSEERLDVLINNAGAFGLGNQITEDGIVEGMQVNHFAPFLLTLLLVPLLKKTQASRIINVNSTIHYLGFFSISKLNTKGYYGEVRTYANSKLCNLILTMELSKRLNAFGIVVNALHPGIIETNLLGNTNAISRFGFKVWCWACCRSAEAGAQTTLYLAVDEESANITGKYFVDLKPRFTLWKARDQALARKLWTLSTSLVGYDDDFKETSIT